MVAMAAAEPGAGEVPGAQTVRRAMAVLRLVAMGQEEGVRLSDIATMSGLSRPTVHRLLKVLIDETAVEQDPATRRYRVGDELSLLGLARAGRLPLRALAEPYLQALAAEVGDTVFLSLRHGADSVCIARHLGSQPIQVLSINVGVRRPLGASVSGIVLLAGLPPTEAERLTRGNAPRLALQQREADEVLRQVRAARRAGHAFAPQGVMPGTAAVAVPVCDAGGQVLAAISIAALRDRLDRKRLPGVLAAMHEQAALIARRHAEVQAARRRTTRREPRSSTTRREPRRQPPA
ncbi:MAG: IclR family transcriptional regulator [Rubrivivax sp.]|nr:IclR family transcriptional regulator [Rubrivivax sp.]